jgi:hypothetical protein
MGSNSYETDLAEHLYSIVERYKENPMKLSKDANIDYKTAKSILEKEKKKSYSSNVILNICYLESKICSVKGNADYFGGAIKKYLEKIFPAYFCEYENLNYDVNLNKNINDLVSFCIVWLADIEEGRKLDELVLIVSRLLAKKEHITNNGEFSERAINAFVSAVQLRVQQMIESSFLIEENGKLRTRIINLDIPFDIVRRYISDLLLFCDNKKWATESFFTYCDLVNTDYEKAQKGILAFFEGYTNGIKIMKSSIKKDLPVNVVVSVESLKI